MRDRKMRDDQNAGWKMQDWKMRDQYAAVENAGQWSMESLFANKCAEAVRMQNSIGFSSFDTVTSNSCTICFVFTYVFSVCLLSAVFMDLFL